MDRQKINSANVNPDGTVLNPKNKSWVASRFVLVEESGVYKRRCSFGNCGKEYSRGTSHMILKRHWSRSHGDNPPITKRTTPYKKPNNCSTGSSHKSPSKRALHSLAAEIGGSSRTNKTGSKILGNRSGKKDELDFDVKLVARRLKEASSIQLGFDIYTPKKGGKSFGIISAHSLGEFSDIKTVLLEYKHLPYPDDSTAIFEFLRSCILKFNIREKIVSIVTNCSNSITSAMQELDKKLRLSKNFNFETMHIQCFPQLIHLNVIDLLKSQENVLDSVRRVVGFINNNNFTVRQVHENNPNPGTVDGNNGAPPDSPNKTTGLKLPIDNKSNWSTTYNMIDMFIQQRGFIEPTIMYYRDPQDISMNIDWDKLFTIEQFLLPFQQVINKFSLENYAPVSVISALIPHLIIHLSKSDWSYYEDLAIVAHDFKLQLESYQQTFRSDLTVLATLLDPKIKDAFVTPEERQGAIDVLKRRYDSAQFAQAKSEAYARYEAHVKSIWADIEPPAPVDELASYFERGREFGGANMISYWECNKKVYPCLYNIARSVACIQVTSVPSDRMFSAAENVVRERKIQIENTNARELARSWAKYLEK